MGSLDHAATTALPSAKETTAELLVSIVVPCMNESMVIGEFVDWCKEGLSRLHCPGQILIVDSSEDNSPEIARAHGAEVLTTPRRGLGQAYKDALAHIRGKYVILGDSDLTYDFRELEPFIKSLQEGHEFVMGTRLKGRIEPGAMPALHRYFGTPVTTWLLNRLYGTSFSDIHCGMRALTRRTFERMRLDSPSWEYASEMVLKASLLRLRMAEVPIHFMKDRPGRVSVHKREGWLSPWFAGWNNVKIMLIYAPHVFLLKPGLILFGAGMVLALALARGPVHVGRLDLRLHAMLLGMMMATIGYSAIQLGIISKLYHRFASSKWINVARRLTYNRGMTIAGFLGLAGLILNGSLVYIWITHGLKLSDISYSGVFGLLLLILSFQTFAFTLLLEMMYRPRYEDDRKYPR